MKCVEEYNDTTKSKDDAIKLRIYFELSQWMINNKIIVIENPQFPKDDFAVSNKVYKANSVKIGKIPTHEIENLIKYLQSKFPTVDNKIISNIVKKYEV